MSALAVDALAPVTIDGVVAEEDEFAIGAESQEYESDEQAGEFHGGPASGGEDALVSAGLGGGEGSEVSDEVGDGVPPGTLSCP